MTSEIIEKPMSAECTMKQYEAIPDADFVENREYQLTDYPDNGANAEQMAYALTCKRLFPAGTVVTFSGTTDDNYTNGHLYQIEVDTSGTKSWKDITPTGGQSIPIITGTQEKPINLATDLEVGKWYLLRGYVRWSAYANTHIQSPSGSEFSILAYKIGEYEAVMYNVNWFTSNSINPSEAVMLTKFNENGYIAENLIRSKIATLNGVKGNGTVNIYAPTTSGTANQILQSNGSNKAPTWVDPATLGLATTADIEATIGNVSTLLGDTSDLEV